MHIGISTLMMQRGKTGVAQYLFGLLGAFSKQPASHRFTLFVLEEDLPLFGFLKSRLKLFPVPERFRPAVRNISWHQLCLPRLVRRLSLDLVHVPSYRRLLWPKPCPLVATIHDLAPFHIAHKYDWKRMFYGRVVVRWLARRQDRIIAVSQNTADDLNRFFGLSRRHIEVVHNGIDHERFCPGSIDEAKAVLARRHRIQKPFFLYVARLEHPGKNHFRLIKAFETFKTVSGSDWQLVFGGSDWHGAEVIHSAIRASGFRNDIIPLGFVDEAVLPELYRAADAFVYPSLFEGFGLPPVEAMACGCPVISSARGALSEVIGQAALTVDPENTEDIALKLATLAGEAGARRRLREAGIKRAAHFDWNRAAAETLAVYTKTAALLQPAEFVRGAEAPVR